MKKFKKLFLVFVLALLFIPCVKAEEIKTYDTLLTSEPTNVEYRKDNMKAEDDLNLTGNYNSSTFFAGNSVYDATNVDGISFVAGNDVNINGNYEYGFVAGNIVDVKGKYQKDVFVFGNMVSFSNEFSVANDMYLFGATVTLNGNIGRNLFVAADRLVLENVTINGDVNVSASSITFGDNVLVNGTFKYNEDANLNNMEKASISTILTYEIENDLKDVNKFAAYQDFLLSVVGLILLGVVLYALCPSAFEKLKEKTNNYTFVEGLKDSAAGLLTLIGYPIFMLILLFTVICIPISIIGLILYGIAIYMTTLFVGYLVGDLLFRKAMGKEVSGFYSIIIGVLIVKILKLIPFIGGFISFIVLCLGLGLIVKLLFSKRNKEVASENIIEAEVKEKKTTKKIKKEEK